MSGDNIFTGSTSKRQSRAFAVGAVLIAAGSFLAGYELHLHKDQLTPAAAVISQKGMICDIQPPFMPGVKKIRLVRSSAPRDCSLSGLGSDMEFHQLKRGQDETEQNFVTRVAMALKSSVPGQDVSGPTAFAFKVSAVSPDSFYRSGGGVLQTRLPSNAYNLPWVLTNDTVGLVVKLKIPPGILQIGEFFENKTGGHYTDNLPDAAQNSPMISSDIGIYIPISEPLRDKILGKIPSYEHYQFGNFSSEQAEAFENNLYILFSVTPDLSNPIALEMSDKIDDVEYVQFEGLRMKPGGNWALVRSDTNEVVVSGAL